MENSDLTAPPSISGKDDVLVSSTSQASALATNTGSRAIASKVLPLNEAELERHRIVARRHYDPTADIYRMLRTKVLMAMSRTQSTTLALTSPNGGEGTATTAINLALSLALDVKQTVLLVDLDLRNPRVHKYLGISNDVGVSDYILQDTPVPDCLVRVSVDRLVVLPSGKPLENSSEVLGTPKMTALAHELRTRYPDRIVMYVLPPLLTQDDTIVFMPNVDSILLVVREGTTEREDVRRCLQGLSHTNVIGTVLNASYSVPASTYRR